MVVDADGMDIVCSDSITGVKANWLRASLEQSGLDPDNLPESDPSAMNFGSGGNTDSKAWKDIWGCGQGVGAVKAVAPTADVIERMARDYETAKAALCKS